MAITDKVTSLMQNRTENALVLGARVFPIEFIFEN